MLLLLLSAAIALACALASTRRLAIVVTTFRLDPRLVLDAIAVDRSGLLADGLRGATAQEPGLTVEHALLEARTVQDHDMREALVGEVLGEVQGRAQQWARVPRVCASVASSSGFLLASLAVIRAMDAMDTLEPERHASQAQETLATALGAFALGVAGASYCAAVHIRARRVHRERMSALTALVDWELSAKRPNS